VLNYSQNSPLSEKEYQLNTFRWVRFKHVEGVCIYGDLEGFGISGDLPLFCNDVSTTELQMRYVGVVKNNE